MPTDTSPTPSSEAVSPGAPVRILISAGEASGENYGAMLIAELRRLLGADTQFFGVGGERMHAAGFDSIVDSGKVAAVGITEVVRHVAGIYREFFRVVSAARARRPDVAILIDFPDFNLRLAGKLKAMGVPVVYFVSPQLWAWKQRRIWRVKKFVDRMLVIFPFEEDYYRQREVAAQYVGHPLADLPLPEISRGAYAQQYGLNAAKQWIAMLPGSRQKEVRLNLPPMLESARLMGSGYEYLIPVASTLSRDWIAQAQLTAGTGVHLVEDARAALLHARAGVVASGTATVEAALIATPFIVVYRVSGLTFAIGKRLVKVKNYGMVNLIAGREIVPELIQYSFTPGNVVDHLNRLIPDGQARTQMIRDLEEIRNKLNQVPAGMGENAIGRTARVVVETMTSRRQERVGGVKP